MKNQKADTLLSLLLTEDPKLRQLLFSLFMPSGTQAFLLIVRYHPSFSATVSGLIPLLGSWGILSVRQEELSLLLSNPFLEYAMLPRRIEYQLQNAKAQSCISSEASGSISFSEPSEPSEAFRSSSGGETGKGILIAIIDSGIDVNHPDFRNPDGSTRILALWDQTLPTNASSGKYRLGEIFSREQINEILMTQNEFLASTDRSGHGTHVAGICAGNGAASNGRLSGVAPDASLLIVKLYPIDGDAVSTTAYLMMAIDWCVETALQEKAPLVINLSYGNNYGSHTGTEMLDDYLDLACGIGQNCICIGTGNEGIAGKHTVLRVPDFSGLPDTPVVIEWNISPFEAQLNLQLWKSFVDDFDFTVIAPDGSRSMLITRAYEAADAITLQVGRATIILSYNPPTPFTTEQEIQLLFLPDPETGYIPSGIWQLEFTRLSLLQGACELWLPSGNENMAATRFLQPSETTTLTIPSTALLPISVAGYNSRLDSVASFSGRGFTSPSATTNPFIKPDLCAPAVDIISAAPGGRYTTKSGTSMAVPFVSGACARLMEWGIKKGNDPFLYGEKIKAYLIRGARQLPALSSYPNPITGYGALCLKNSYPPFLND